MSLDLVSAYHTAIVGLGEQTGASDSLLHVHAGLAVLFAACLVTGRSVASFVPLAIVVLAACANELLDFLHADDTIMPDTGWDLANTLFWPFVLTVVLRASQIAHTTGDPAGEHCSVDSKIAVP
jgi:heme/copper-type cytochrome/quinol oxidase subunit 4